MRSDSVVDKVVLVWVFLSILIPIAIVISPNFGIPLYYAIGAIITIAILAIWIKIGYEVLKIGIRKFAQFRHSPLAQWKKDRKVIGIVCIVLLCILIYWIYEDYIKYAIAIAFLAIVIIMMGYGLILTIFDGIKAMARKFGTPEKPVSHFSPEFSEETICAMSSGGETSNQDLFISDDKQRPGRTVSMEANADRVSAVRVCRTIAASVSRKMKNMEPCLSSDFNNAWDEFCDQAQGIESIYYDEYLEMALSLITKQIDMLDQSIKVMIWHNLSSPEPEIVLNPADDSSVNEDAMAEFILESYVLKMAGS